MAFLVVFPGVAVTLHLAGCPSSAGALLRGWLEGVPAAWEEMGQCTAAPDLTASVLEASVVVEEAVVWWWPPCLAAVQMHASTLWGLVLCLQSCVMAKA